MAEFILGCVIFLFALLLWAALGHGIWLMLHAIVRALTGQYCYRCEAWHRGGTCPKCSVQSTKNKAPSAESDLSSARRLVQLARFHQWLDEKQIASIETFLNSLTERVYAASRSAQYSESTQASVAAVADHSQNEMGTERSDSALRVDHASLVEPRIVSEPAQLEQRQLHQITHPAALQTSLHPLDEPEAPESSVTVKLPIQRRLTAQLLHSFMEKTNIRWIELISAALIVICSVGLVISLWSTLSRTSRFFPSLVFLLATLAIHGAGQYTLRQWKLKSTSRGILHIGLMLIPLSMLVGILLSRRENSLPVLDASTLGAVALGALVYGGLAITASKSLFGRHWRWAANVVIVASLTLLPIHFLAARHSLESRVSVLILIPMVAVSLGGSLVQSRWSMRIGGSAAVIRRVAGVTVQCLFSSLVTFIFWVLQTRSSGGVFEWWWLTVGVVAGAWACWGWAASVNKSAVQFGSVDGLRESKMIAGSSWFVIFGWCVATLCTCFLAFSLWQVSIHRAPLCGMLVLLGLWGGLHGWFCNAKWSIAAGGLSLLLASALLISLPFEDSIEVRATDWLGFPRIMALTLLGVGGASLLALRPVMRRAQPRIDRVSFAAQPFATSEVFVSQWIVSASVLVAGAAALTLIASFVHSGPTPYGGNWAPLLLLIYGTLSLAAGILSVSNTGSAFVTQKLVPIGLLTLLIATLRLCQTSPMLAGVLGHLRPLRSWAVGAAGLALIWSMLAAVVRIRCNQDGATATGRFPFLWTQQKFNIGWLTWAASLLALLSGFASWTAGDHLLLASQIGWMLPLTCLAIGISWRQTDIRELSLVSLVFWALSATYHFGHSRGWWAEIGLASTCGAFVIVGLMLVHAYQRLLLTINSQGRESWFVGGEPWASTTLSLVSWLSLIITLMAPTLTQIAARFSTNWVTEDNTFFVDRLGHIGFGFVLVASLLVSGTSYWIGSLRNSSLMRSSVAFLPVVTAMAVAAWVTPELSILAALWILAIWLLGSDIAQFFVKGWDTQSVAAWRLLVKPSEKYQSSCYWLPLGRLVSSAVLLVGTIVYIVGILNGRMHLAGAEWSARCFEMLLPLGPACSVFLVRWGVSVWNGEKPAVTVLSGSLFALMVGCIGSLALASNGWASRGIVLVQSVALVSASLAWCTVTFTALRNFLSLRRILGSQIGPRVLLSKALKGVKWQRSENAGWVMISLAMLSVLSLCCASAIVVVAYPAIRLPGISRLGAESGLAIALLSWSLYWTLAVRRGVSSFGLAALTLGAGAPLGAVSYARVLTVDASRSFEMARDFEPFRLMIVLWLAALVVGLVFRVIMTRRGRMISRAGDLSWVALAIVVGSLALISTLKDPNPTWATGELSFLALLAVISSIISGQKWRGHVAAMLAAAGLAPPLLYPPHSILLQECWLVLWGPIWVAGAAVLAKLISRSNGYVESEVNAGTGRFAFSIDQAASLSVPITAAILSFLWIASGHPTSLSPNAWLFSVAGLSGATLCLSTTRLWDKEAGKRGLAVYFSLISLSLVLSASLCFLGDARPLETWLLWLGSGLGAMAVLAGMLRELVRESSRIGTAFRLSSIVNEPAVFRQALGWMPALHTLAALLALVPSVVLVLAFDERGMRIAATALPFVGSLAILPIAVGVGKQVFRYCGLLLISSTLVLLWWADLPSAWSGVGDEGTWIFVQRAFAALMTLGVLYPFVPRMLRNKADWEAPLMSSGWLCCGLGVALGLAMLVGQWAGLWRQVAVEAGIGSKVLTIFAWAALFFRLLKFATRPHSTDRTASVQLRTFAVYASEVVLGLLCGACYFHFPNLFSGMLVNWWPIAVFAIAMLSAAVGEWLRRVDEPILADPVRRSSLLLPLIPLAGVWWIRPESGNLQWNEWGRYAFLLLAASSLYGLHGWIRNSISLRTFSAGLGLLAFWAFLHSHPTMRFAEHPQFWLLPPAIAALGFVELNRVRLESHVVGATRYLAILIAYLSSTAEVFLKAFEGQLWQPLVLLVIALLGVAAGVVMRVRAFLYCGSLFTFVALLGMVWHAQQAIGQVWPWWVFGIATGVGLIVLLGYFEKYREKILAYLERLKTWES